MTWRDDPKVREYRDPTLWPDDYAINAAAMEAAVAAYKRWLASRTARGQAGKAIDEEIGSHE